MVKIKIFLISFSIIFATSLPSLAVLYKYTDSKGIVHITDKISTIPSKYKPQIVKKNETIPLHTPTAAKPSSELTSTRPSSEFEPAPASAVPEPEKPVVSEFTLTTPAQKEIKEEPVESAAATPVEKPSEFQAPSAEAAKKTEKPKISEFTPESPKKTEPVQQPETKSLKAAETDLPVQAPQTAVETAAVQADASMTAQDQDQNIKPQESLSSAAVQPIVPQEAPSENIPIEKGYITTADEPVTQAALSPRHEPTASAPTSMEKPPESKPAAEPSKLQPQPAPSASPEESPRQRAKQMDLAKLTEQRTLLAEKKAALTKKFDALMKERKRLEAAKDTLTDPASIDQYNQDVKALNENIKKYKEEEKALKAEIEAFNQAIQSASTN